LHLAATLRCGIPDHEDGQAVEEWDGKMANARGVYWFGDDFQLQIPCS
jgi:hypothetical protein